MGISLKPQHLNRYRQIAWLFVKDGRSDLVKEAGLDETLAVEPRVSPKEAAKASELAEDLEKLGATFLKLGQLLSTRVELMPRVYIEALARLQDNVEPFAFDEVEEIVSSELGVRMSKAFSGFDVTPMAAASLGKVHRARLNKIIDAIVNNELKISVDAIDEKTLVLGFQKVANRITVGLIIAALIVGAAMMMQVETSFRIWGYPGLAILLFLAAAGGGVILLINILFYDKGKAIRWIERSVARWQIMPAKPGSRNIARRSARSTKSS